MIEYSGWVASIVTLMGVWAIGNKCRWGFLLGVLGEMFWIVYSYHMHSWELGLMSAVFVFVYFRNYWRWGCE